MQQEPPPPANKASAESDRLRAELREKDRRLETLIANLPGMVYRCLADEHWTMELVSEGCLELTGYQAEDLLFNSRVSYEQITHPADRLHVREVIRIALDAQRRFSVEYRIVCKDGTVRWVAESGVGVRAGDAQHIEGFVQDISERKLAEIALVDAEKRYREIFENATEGIFQSTADGHYLRVNPALAAIYGYDTPHALINSLSNIGAQLYVEPGRREEFMTLIRSRGGVNGFVSQVYRRGGEIIWISENARSVHDSAGQFLHFEGTVVDVSAMRRYEDQLKFEASHDSLTGLPNRALLLDRLGHSIAYARRQGGQVGVAFIDLDHFKDVNDSLGHEAGDVLLQTMAERMSHQVRECDTVARLGGDEFVLVLGGESDESALRVTLDRLRDAVGQPWTMRGRVMHVTCSIGASVYPRDGDEPQTLLQNADTAMYEAKTSGRDAVRFYTSLSSNADGAAEAA